MRDLLDESLEQGAIGMSSGLFYAPASAATTDEVAEVAKPLGRWGGIYTAHMRDEADNILKSLDETFEIGRRAGAPVVVSHHKCSGRQNFGRMRETLPKIDAIILDKTGTVTEGKFSLLEILPCNELQREVLAATVSANSQKSARECSLPSGAPINSGESLSFLASIEQYSEHPLGAAVTQFARQQKAKIYDATAVQIHKGLGITGTVERRRVFAGNRRFLRDLGISIDDQSDKFARQREAEGKSVSFFGWDGDVHAVAVFGDRVRSEAIELSEELRRQKIEIRLVSGDAQATTKWVASSLGIESYEAEVLPQHKIDVVRRLQERGSVVAMVGDGINDAPALAQADLGIAMGSGTDIAMRAASVVLVNGGLGKILDVFDVSHKAMRVVRQNLFWAFLYNSIGITFAVMGILNPIMAAMAMLLSSVSVVGNSMRLTRQQAWLPRSKTV
jgi:cation transport ATPase